MAVLYYESQLCHHGIKGQRWGVRRFQDRNGRLTRAGELRYGSAKRSLFGDMSKELSITARSRSDWGVEAFDTKEDAIIPAATRLKRIALHPADNSYDNKKYLCINSDDYSKWESYMGNGYKQYNEPTFGVTYRALRKLKIMSIPNQELVYAKMLKDPVLQKQAEEDIDLSNRKLGVRPSDSPSENLSRMIAAQTQTAAKFRELIASEYDGIVDVHGMNVSDTPIVVFNPDKNLERYPGYTLTKATEELIKEQGIRK